MYVKSTFFSAKVPCWIYICVDPTRRQIAGLREENTNIRWSCITVSWGPDRLLKQDQSPPDKVGLYNEFTWRFRSVKRQYLQDSVTEFCSYLVMHSLRGDISWSIYTRKTHVYRRRMPGPFDKIYVQHK